MRKMWVQFAKTGNPSLPAEISPDGAAKEWPLYDTENKYVMVFDEFDIHPEKEAEQNNEHRRNDPGIYDQWSEAAWH